MPDPETTVVEERRGVIKCPEPGIYRGIPAEEYHRWDAVSNSQLKVLAQKSPKHFNYERQHPKAMTKAMSAGQLLHKLCLERFAFAAEYGIGPKGLNRKAKVGWAKFEEANAPKPCITRSEFDNACGMADALMEHERARTLLTDGEPEVSIVWDDAEEGIRCRARLDYLLPPAIGDIKTTSDGDEWNFGKAAARYAYHQQAAFYLDGARAVGLEVNMFALAVVESDAPYDVYVGVLQSNTMAAGRAAYRRALHYYRNCLASGVWEGRCEHGIMEIEIPRYALEAEGIITGGTL